MLTDDEWSLIRAFKSVTSTGNGSGTLRIALVFGAVAAVAALFATPWLEKTARIAAAKGGVDTVTTGSVSSGNGGSTYVIRRSILQESTDAVCVIAANGRSEGDCP